MRDKPKKMRKGYLLKIVFLGFVLYSAATLVNLQVQISDKEQIAAQYRSSIAEQKLKNENLQSELSQGMSEEKTKKIAREKLGLADPDEEIYLNISGN